MRDEENDIRIREAAENYHPAFDETAWDKMEKMLDEHLPQKKRRRKIFFYLPFLLLLGGLTIFIVWNDKGNYSLETSGISMKDTRSRILIDSTHLPDKLSNRSISDPLNKQKILQKSKFNLPIIATNTGNRKTNQSLRFSMNSNGNKKHNFKENLRGQPNVLLEQGFIVENNNKNKITINTETGSSIPTGNDILNNKIIYVITENKTESSKANNHSVVNEPQIKEQNSVTKSTNTKFEIIKKKTKNTNRFKNNFGVTLSAGPFLSGVNINNTGKINIDYGAGLSYAISKKFRIRTGFYKSKKIYSVEGYDYHFPDGSGGNYDNLLSVDANCNVDEIPFNLYYNFGKKRNHNWFVSAGLSSYLMKKESYEYYYKTISGEIYSNDMTIKNKNKNLFSVLNLSAGYQHTFNKQFSIMAEPYINLPLSGIGAGKVKLNSGGVLFTIVMKPFLKNGK